MKKLSKRILLIDWVPVVLMLGIIIVESTDLLSSEETGGLIYPAVNWIWNAISSHNVDPELFARIHSVLRKAGHLCGYGFLCALTFRAIRGTVRERMGAVERGWDWFWQQAWAGYALLVTIVVASADEMHQSMLDSRTGSFRDVLIDASGAVLALAIIYLYARHCYKAEHPHVLHSVTAEEQGRG